MAKQKKKTKKPGRGKRPYRPKQTSDRPPRSRRRRLGGGTASVRTAAAGPKVQRFRWPGDTSTRPSTAGSAAPGEAAPAVDPVASLQAFAAAVPRLSPAQLDALSDPAHIATLMAEAAARREAERPPPKRLVIQPVRGGRTSADRGGPEPGDADDLATPADPAQLAKGRSRGQLAGLVFLVAGLAFSAWIVEDVARDAAAQHWQTTPGKVTVCKSERVSSDPPRYVSHFAYRYKAGGKWHTGRRVRFAGGQGDPVRTYKVGQKLKVYLDPEDSAVSTLQPGVIGWAWAQLIAGLVAAALGGLYLVLAGRRQAG